jgi:hypothetical protein
MIIGDGAGRRHLEFYIWFDMIIGDGAGRRHLEFYIWFDMIIGDGAGRRHLEFQRRDKELTNGRISDDFDTHSAFYGQPGC